MVARVFPPLGTKGEDEACWDAVKFRGLALLSVDTLCPLKPPPQN